jgi:L-arabinokinase
MRIVFHVSGHGFGHASRDGEVIDAIFERDPGAIVVVRTSAPAWLFAGARRPVEVQPAETDTGLSQIDSLRFDEQDTVRRAADFYATFAQRVDQEAALLGSLHADVVVGDIPPIAFAAAERAGVPSVAIGNFTWDWIYGAYGAFDRHPSVLPTIRAAYRAATSGLRLPFHGGFEPMAGVIEDIPLVARRSRRDAADTRRMLGLSSDRPVVLASFGAYGARLPLDTIRATNDFTLLADERLLRDGLRYEDLVAAADVVVSKPGYGIASECVANGTALVYASRGEFAEYDVLVAEMPRVLRCREIAQQDLFAGRWSEAVSAVLAQPPPPERWRVDGAQVAAERILSRG